MKKPLFSLWSLLLILGVFTVTSCTDDETLPDPPTFEVTNLSAPSGSQFDIGDPISFTVTVTAPGGLKSLQVIKQRGTAEPEVVVEPIAVGGTTEPYPHEFSYQVMVADGGKEVALKFIAEDNEGQEGTFQYNFTVNEPPITAYSNVRLVSAQPDSTSKTWFSTLRGETFSSKEIKAQIDAGNDISGGIDISYFYGDNMNATISSPSFYPKADSGFKGWGNINVTNLRNSTMTPAEFAQISTFDDLEEAYINGITNKDNQDPNATYHQDRIMKLSANKVVVFKTDPNYNGGSRYGALLVTEVKGTRGAQDYIQFDMKVMPIPAE